MAIGLTRNEQWGLLGLAGLILAGLGIQHWGDVGSGDVAVEGQWQKLGEFAADAGAPTTATLGLRRGGGSDLPAGGIDLNAATAAELDRLPNVGPARAESMIRLRESLGGFTSVDQLADIRGISPRMVDELRPFIRVAAAATTPTQPLLPTSAIPPLASPVPNQQSPTLLTGSSNSSPPPAPTPSSSQRININTATEQQLMELEGIGPTRARAIILDRAARGPFRRPEELQRVKGIGEVTLRKNLERITVE